MKNDWFKLLLTGIAIFIMRTTVLAHAPAEGYKIKIRLTEFDKDTIYLGYALGNQTYLRDTAILDKKTGFFTFQRADKKLEAGVYLVVTPLENQTYFQIMVDADEQHFTMTTNTLDPYGQGKFTGSKDNDLFYNYMRFLSKKRGEAEAAGELRKTNPEAATKKLEALDKEVKSYQNDLIQNNPKSISAMLIKTAIEVETPLFPEITDKDKNEFARYIHYKEHFFDNFDMGNPALLRTNGMAQRIDTYIEKLTPQHPDSISQSLDRVLELVKPCKESFQHFFVEYLNKYIKSNIVGYDAIHVHLTKKYIETGIADFIPKENKIKLVDQANKLFPILIGKKATDIKTFKEDNSMIALSEITSKYTILFFYAPDCGHCQKQSPLLVEFLQKAKAKNIDVKVLAVCTYVGTDKMPECWKYAKEKGFGDFINTVDPYLISRYKTLFNVETTPQVYVLDENKTIRSKGIEAKQLEEVLDHIILEDNAKLKKEVKGN